MTNNAVQVIGPSVRDDFATTDGGRGWRPSRRMVERILSVVTPVLLIGLWELAARQAWLDVRFFPAPSSVAEQFGKLSGSGELWSDLAVTLKRIGIGFALGAVPGVLLGLAMGLFPFVRAAFQPLVDATFPIPKIALLPLFLLIFGIGDASKYAVVAVSIVYLVLINTQAGVRNIGSIYFDVASQFGAGRWILFRDIALPGALPMILAGLRLGLGVSLIVMVAAEFTSASDGIGALIWTSWQTFDVETMYVGIVLTAVIGFGMSLLLTLLERLLMPWQRGGVR